MKHTLLIYLSILLSSIVVAQSSVTIQVELKSANSNNVPIATAVLYHFPDSIKVAAKTIREKQVFEVQTNTQYFLNITAVGMQPILYSFSVKDSAILVQLQWEIKTNDLDNVVVVAKKPLIKQEDDKTIVDAEVLSNSSINAYEVLEKIPGAVVDSDGNVYLNSATPAMIQINGREVKISAADLTSLLKSLPANSVSKIEILRTPSAKYDASSSGGIVNIVLKKGVKLGTNGSVNAGYFQGRLNTKTIGVNINKNVGKVNTNISYQYTDRNNFEELNSNRFIERDTSLVAQTAYTTYPAINHYLSAGVDIELPKKWTIGYGLRLSTNQTNSEAQNDVVISKSGGALLTDFNNSIINNNGQSIYAGNDWYANKKIDTIGSVWETGISYDYFSNNNNQLYKNNITLPVISFLNGDGDIDNRKNIFTFESDLTLKLPNSYTLETGTRFTYSSSKNSSIYFTNNGSGAKLDSFQSNRFKYNEQIAAVYMQVAKTFGELTVKPGLRMEYTNISGTQLFPIDTSLGIKRTDLFPYIYLRHPIAKVFGFKLTGNLIYRKSISRPYYEALNPYPKYIDQYLYEIGNPRLTPQFTSNYEFNITADNFPIFSVGLNDIQDVFTNVTYQDNQSKIVYRTFDNLGRNRELYLRIIGGIPPGGNYFFYMGAQHNFTYYEGLYQGQPLNYKRGTWTFFMYHNYKPTPSFNIAINGFMRLKGLQNFYELQTFGQLNISLNKTILNKKMNVIVSANDIFRTNQYSFNLQQAGIVANGNRLNDTRRVGLTIRYNFGIKPKQDNNNTFDVPAQVGNE
ncbi:MAG: outer membrane beta-barrel protein [Ferruginibacter sp.]